MRNIFKTTAAFLATAAVASALWAFAQAKTPDTVDRVTATVRDIASVVPVPDLSLPTDLALPQGSAWKDTPAPLPSVSLPSLAVPTIVAKPAAGTAALSKPVTSNVKPPAGSFAATASRTISSSLIRSLNVEPRAEDKSYSRVKQFGDWTDVDRNGCDTRNDMLRRDLAQLAMKGTSKCVVESGILADPYTGTTFAWKRAQVIVKGVGQYVDIDHVVPLKVVWYSGGRDWTQAQRLAIANDPENLVVADAYTNRNKKGDKSIGEWAPASPCQYASAYAHIVEKYELSVDRDDATALQKFAAQCK